MTHDTEDTKRFLSDRIIADVRLANFMESTQTEVNPGSFPLKRPIYDPYFEVLIDWNATSPSPDKAIWYAQHTCVAEGFSPRDKSPECPGEAIIKHQLNVEHFSVLNFAFIKFDVAGFPHNTVMQLVRHQDSKFLVQSNRYTGERFIKVAKNEIPVESVFYVRPENEQFLTRNGAYSRSNVLNDTRYNWYKEACQYYALEIESGVDYEDARDLIPTGFRQNFTISCTVEAFFHLLDQRSKKDSQLEIQTLAVMLMEKFMLWSPVLGRWYLDRRWGKARLAP